MDSGVEEDFYGVVFGEFAGLAGRDSADGGLWVGGSERDVLRQKRVGGGENGGALEGVFQFADIAGPGVGLEHADGFLGKFEAGRVRAVGDFLQEILGE